VAQEPLGECITDFLMTFLTTQFLPRRGSERSFVSDYSTFSVPKRRMLEIRSLCPGLGVETR